MAPRSDSPKRADVASLAELGKRGDDDSCLDYLRDLRFPDGTPCPGCGRRTRFHRVRGRSAYACQYCRHHVYPMAQTIFGRSKTPLRSWFRAIQLVGARPGSVMANELAAELGITRPTASRMLALIVPAVGSGSKVLLTAPARRKDGFISEDAEAAPSRPAGAPRPLSDVVREELLATLSGLREDLRAAESRALDVQQEVVALREAVAALEPLASDDASSPRN